MIRRYLWAYCIVDIAVTASITNVFPVAIGNFNFVKLIQVRRKVRGLTIPGETIPQKDNPFDLVGSKGFSNGMRHQWSANGSRKKVIFVAIRCIHRYRTCFCWRRQQCRMAPVWASIIATSVSQVQSCSFCTQKMSFEAGKHGLGSLPRYYWW